MCNNVKKIYADRTCPVIQLSQEDVSRSRQLRAYCARVITAQKRPSTKRISCFFYKLNLYKTDNSMYFGFIHLRCESYINSLRIYQSKERVRNSIRQIKLCIQHYIMIAVNLPTLLKLYFAVFYIHINKYIERILLGNLTKLLYFLIIYLFIRSAYPSLVIYCIVPSIDIFKLTSFFHFFSI